MSEAREATIADTTIVYIPPEDRTHQADAFLVAKQGKNGWLVTRRELEDFARTLTAMLNGTEGNPER